MLHCHDMKKGDIYYCKDCGLELQVVKECHDAGTAVEECGCMDADATCKFTCCGSELKKK